MFPKTKEERTEWIVNRRAKFESDFFFKPQISSPLALEAKTAYIQGLYYSTILCTTVALNHLLFLIVRPEVKKRAPSTFSMIKTAKSNGIIDKELMTDLIDFQKVVRDNIEHRKKIAGFEKLFDFLDLKDSEIYDLYEDSPEIYEIIYPYIAFKVLGNYYRLCDSWYDYLIKKKERI